MSLAPRKWITPVLLLLVVVGLPLLVLAIQARHKGLSLFQFVGQLASRQHQDPATTLTTAAVPSAPRIDFVTPQAIGEPVADPPRICNLLVCDLDLDGASDVVACDALTDSVRWLRQNPPGTFVEQALGQSIRSPAHVSVCDLDRDGDRDLLVASMGMLFPNNDKIGSLVVLENDGQQQFTNRLLLEHVARVTDVEAGDLDGDGDFDLSVAQFGYDDGEIRWLQNQGNWQFDSHKLLQLSGTIHTPIHDMDGDGDLDIVALVSQEWEEIYVFENDGRGTFQTKLVYGSTNEDFGSSGISVADLDHDGDADVLYTNGDAFDYLPPGPRPWHGVQWLENEGGLTFKMHRIGDVPGAYSARPVDVDHDGDEDIFVVSAFNDWARPDAPSLVWFENTGGMAFTYRDLAYTPTHLLALEAADLDNDGEVDFVTGGMHVYPPYDRMGRITLWHNRWPAGKAAP